MGGVKKFVKKSLNFQKGVWGGGYVKDMLRNPVGGFKSAVNDAGGVFGAKPFKIDSGNDQLDAVNSLMGQATEEQKKAMAQSLMYQRKGMAGIGPAYDAARKRVTVGRGASMDRATDNAASMTSDVQQSMAQRGLYNSTVLDNARVGISSQLSRDLAEIDAQYSQMLGQLDIGQQEAMMQGYSGLAGLTQSGAAGLAGSYGNWAQSIASVQMPDPDAWLNNLLGIGGTFLGMGMMGGFGGGAQPPAQLPTNAFGGPLG